MKKLLLLCIVIAAGVVVWKFNARGVGTDGVADLQQRLDAAERMYASAGRAAGVSGIDTSADAEAALAEVERVEQALRELSRNAKPDVKGRVDQLLERAAAIERKMR